MNDYDYTPNNIQCAIDCLKNGKQDGVYDLMTDLKAV